MNKPTQKNIPEGWSIEALESLTPVGNKFGIVDGPFGSNLKTVHYQTQGIPIITSGYVTNGYFHAEKYLYVTEEKFNQEKRSAVRGGDIVMAKIGARCGASAILPFTHREAILSGNALKITIDEKRNKTMYIWQMLTWLYWNNKLDSIKSIGAQPALSMASLKKYKLLLPLLKEQERILRILETWDKAIEALANKIDLKKNIKKGLMQNLLTGKMRLPGFCDKWESIKLGQIASFKKGKGLPKNDLSIDGEYDAIHYGELFTKYNENIEIIISKTSSSKNMFLSKKNDILMPTSDVTPRGLSTASCINKDGIVLGGDILVIRSNGRLNGLFFSYFVNQNKKEVIKLVSGSTVFHLYGSDMARFSIKLPPMNEQSAIVKIIVVADNEISSLEKKLTLLKEQKKFLLNNLITGTIRTPESIK